MARKIWLWKTFVGYIVVNIFIGGALIVFRYGCMQNDTNSFASYYCMRDNNARTVVNVFLTLIVFVLGLALSDAICAYRTLKLQKGINEGVYVAMRSSNIKYIWESIYATRWRYVIIVMLLFKYLPIFANILSNIVINTVPVYIRNKSYVTNVFYGNNFYNVTFQRDYIYSQEDLGKAFYILSLLKNYGVSNSLRSENGEVTTNIIRDQLIWNISAIDGDNTNSFQYEDTIASATTDCTFASSIGLLENYITGDNSVSVNFTNNVYLETIIYNINYAARIDNTITFNSILTYATCNPCNGTDIMSYTVNSSIFTCDTTVFLEEQKIIYTPFTQNIQKVQKVKNVDTATAISLISDPFLLNQFGNMVSYYAMLLEGAVNTQTNIAEPIISFILENSNVKGFYNSGVYDYIHSKICVAISLALNDIWINSNMNNGNETGVDVRLSNIVLQAYFPAWTVWTFVVLLVGTTCILCLIGLVYSHKSLINIKTDVENSLLDNVTHDMIEERQIHFASNDPDEQKKLSFSKTLYCTEDQIIDEEGKPRFRVKISYNNSDIKPNISREYF